MAVVGELHLLSWDEWKKELLEKRRTRWREMVRDRVRVSLLTIIKLGSDEEEDREHDEEEEDTGIEEEEVEAENEAGEMREQKKEDEIVMREAEEMEEEGENEVGRGIKEDKEDNREVIEEDERVDVEEDEVGRGVKEDEEDNREVIEEDESVDVEEDEVARGIKEDEEDNREVIEEDERVDVDEDEVGRGVMEDEDEVEEAEEREVMEAEEIEEEQEEKDNEFEEVEELEKGPNEAEDEVDEEEDRQVREEEQVEEEDDGEEERQEQERIGQYHLTERFGEHSRRTEDENIWRNQESARQEEENLSESVESDDEDSDVTESEDEFSDSDRTENEERAVESQLEDPEELDNPDEKSLRNESSNLGAWTSTERKEGEDETLTLEKETLAESLTIQEEEFQLDQEEESADDEEGDSTEEEEADSDDEEVVKTFHKANYPTDIFRTLTEFRDSSILTDLTLRTADGKSFLVHSPVLAAVSSYVRENVGRRIVNKRIDTDVGLPKWSLYLGKEVEDDGLMAVVEFAYTGLISCLSKIPLQHIKAAAQSMGAPRVLSLCKESSRYRWQKKEKRLTASEQMNISLKSINQLWMDRVGCDVILEAVGGSLHAHRVILAVCSDYFRSMFTLGMRESNQSCVTLPFILASELEAMICSSYSGALSLSWKCIYEMTCTAFQLQYRPALSLCLDFFQKEMNPHYCLDVASFAEAYEIGQLLEVADDFVLRQFPKVACTSKFKDLPAKQLLKYLNSRSLCVQSELVVFKAVVAWIQARPKIRLKLAKELMKTIHFPLMTFEEFKEVQSLDMWSDHHLVDLYEAVFWDFCSNESKCRVYLPKENLVLIGGDQISEDLGTRSISRDLWFGNSLRNHTGVKKAMEWRKLGEMPKPERFCHEVAVFEGQLYVLGGKSYYGTSDILNCVHRYDPLQNSWESLAEMQKKRSAFSAVVLDGKIYAIGGQGDNEYIESVERYCPTANSWSFIRPLDLPVGGHVAKVLQGQIFISGGLSNDNLYLASMVLYDPEKGSTFLSTMANPRARHCMETLGEYLYVAGGITTNKNMSIVDHLACEVYNPAADSWTTFTSLPVPHVGAAGVVLEGKFYVLGGYSEEDYTDTKMVHRYDPTAQTWENMGKMPGPNNDIRATLLCLPSHFRL